MGEGAAISKLGWPGTCQLGVPPGHHRQTAEVACAYNLLMRPLLLVGILAMSGATACSRGGDAPAVRPGVAAGKVVEVTGTVHATRGGEKRALTPASEISGDDVIETGVDGHVVIVLAHNNARWELNKNQSVKVGASDAWSEPKREGVAIAGDEATTTAGRHGEKMAASTSTTGDRAPAAEARGSRINKSRSTPLYHSKTRGSAYK